MPDDELAEESLELGDVIGVPPGQGGLEQIAAALEGLVEQLLADRR